VGGKSRDGLSGGTKLRGNFVANGPAAEVCFLTIETGPPLLQRARPEARCGFGACLSLTFTRRGVVLEGPYDVPDGVERSGR